MVRSDVVEVDKRAGDTRSFERARPKRGLGGGAHMVMFWAFE